MLIQGRRIRSLERHLSAVPADSRVVVALTSVAPHMRHVRAIGFEQLRAGEALLPEPVGPVSRFNAEGTFFKHRDRPMETDYRQVMWHWQQFHGPDRVDQWDVRDVPFQRYQRTFIPPPSVELAFFPGHGNTLVLASPALRYNNTDADRLRHTINLYLEIFGECEILTAELRPYLRPNLRRLNWRVLPPGEIPWPRLQRHVGPILDNLGERVRPVAEHRLALLTEEHQPDFAAAGEGGFSGYLVFGFPRLGIHVVESLLYGNATYIFGDDWERFCRLTKAEVLSQEAQRDRIIHREGWDEAIRAVLAGRQGRGAA